jgi:hypothetical protein
LDASGTGSVLVRLKNPKRWVLLGLGAGAGAGDGRVFERCFSSSTVTSGVGPRVERRDRGAYPDAKLGLGEALRDDVFVGSPNLDLELGVIPVLDSVELVRLCDDGKMLRLLWMTGDGRLRSTMSEVPSLLGRLGLRDPDAGGAEGLSAK